MTEEENFQEMVGWLQDEDPHSRFLALQFLMENPIGDTRLLPYVEALLEDRAITIVSIPNELCEVRRFAAFALAAGRAKAEIDEVVRVQGTFRLYSYKDLDQLMEQFNVSDKCKSWSSKENIRCLIEFGMIPIHDLVLNPKDGAEEFRDIHWNRYRKA